MLLTACGDDPASDTNTPGFPAVSTAPSAGPKEASQAALTVSAGVPASKTAVAGISPAQSRPTTPEVAGTALALAWSDNPQGGVLLEAGVVSSGQGGSSDWQATLKADGTARLTRNPRQPSQASSTEYFMNQARTAKLLDELGRLGVLSAAPAVPVGDTGRKLLLNLKGRTIIISDPAIKADTLNRMLQLVRDSMEAAPPRQAP